MIQGRFTQLKAVFASLSLLLLFILIVRGKDYFKWFFIWREVKKTETMIECFGVVQDQAGAPVDGARVTFQITGVGYDPRELFLKVSERSVFSSNGGKFAFSSPGKSASIRSVDKPGYAIQESLSKLPDITSFNRNSKSPVVIILRKRIKGSFLLRTNPTTLRFEKGFPREMAVIDLVKDSHNYILSHEKEDLAGDFTVVCRENKQTGPVLALRPIARLGGCFYSTDKMYLAPDHGYESQLVLAPGRFAKSTGYALGYIYVRSRALGPNNGPIYSRIALCALWDDGKNITVHFGESVTNPYGERGLEEIEFPAEDRLKLTKTIREAIGKNQMPTKNVLRYPE
jgi:hypothetical protein